MSAVASNAGAAGVDGQECSAYTYSDQAWQQWRDRLLEELRTKTYRPSPVRRVRIPKGDGKTRPLGIPTVKDRVVQTAVAILLLPIWEADSHPHSYAYRPKRNAHQAMDAIKTALLSGRTEVIDADLSGYFDSIPHQELLRLVARRVSDGRILALLKAWLRAPIVEHDSDTGRPTITGNRRGTPQGGVISPLLANLYLSRLDWQVNERCELRPVLVRYADGVVCRLVKYDLATGKTAEIKLPASGTVGVSCPDWRTDHCLVYMTSWTSPVTIYDFDAQKDTFAKSIFNTDVSYPGFENLVSEEVEVPGHDGTMIPLSIIYQKGMPLDGSNSCLLTGYGAYGYSYNPSFDMLNDSLATHGVVIAIAHVRGGSEKGEAWYKAGFKTTKPNTWKDFISCAEYLVKQGYTSPRKLAGTGTSAGGILISRAITDRPDLFAAAVCDVGCANTMRSEFEPTGPINTPEFGTVKDPVECQALFEMDGVQHVQKGVKYPAVMGVGGWNDPRVEAWEPGKFVATLQAATASGKPVLMKVNYDSGHFTEEKIVTFKNYAGQFAFLLWQTGHQDFQPVR